MASTVVSALFGSYDLRNAKQWRDEDMTFRDQEVQWLNDDIVRAHQWRLADIERSLRREKLESEHVLCDARSDQLATISEQCALFCGFTVAGMCNVGIPGDISAVMIFFFAVSATAVCISLLLCALMCTHLQLAVTRYAAQALEDSVNALDVHELEWKAPFSEWWLKKCERDQMVAHRFMLTGIALFFLYLGIVAWFQFGIATASASSVSGLALAGFLIWQLRIAAKWRYLLTPPTTSNGPLSTSPSSPATPVSRGSLHSLSLMTTPKTPLSSAFARRKLSMTTATAASTVAMTNLAPTTTATTTFN